MLRRPAVASLLLLSIASSFVGYAQLNAGMPAFARAVGEVSTSRPTTCAVATTRSTARALQLASIIAPPIAGVLVGRHLGGGYVGMLVVGSLAVALFAMTHVERQLPPGVNGVHTSAGDGVGLKASVGEPSAAVGVVSG